MDEVKWTKKKTRNQIYVYFRKATHDIFWYQVCNGSACVGCLEDKTTHLVTASISLRHTLWVILPSLRLFSWIFLLDHAILLHVSYGISGTYFGASFIEIIRVITAIHHFLSIICLLLFGVWNVISSYTLKQ